MSERPENITFCQGIATRENGEEFACTVEQAKAAPDLLAALEIMVNKATKQNWNDMYPEQLEQAFAAIDKATA